MQSELLARSGFQPYRPDERHLHPAGAQFPMDAFSPFGPIPGLQTSKNFNASAFVGVSQTLFRSILGGLFNPAALSYPEALYLDPRLQSMLRSNPHAALYSQLASPYASHLYGMMPGGPPNLSGLHERIKLEEEHRARIAREEEKARIAREEEKAREREREMREKEMREREQREKEMREREQREKEMREREMREKEMREREQREKEMREREMREKEMREREKLLQQHHFMQSQRNPYNLLGLFPQMVGLRPPSSMHPGYPMHPSLLGLSLPSQIPTSLSNSLSMHHSQSQQSSSPVTSTSSMSASMSLMPPIGAGGSLMGLNHPVHGLPHGMSLFPGNLPPPAHHYSPLAPPSASPSGMSSSSYNHPMMIPVSSPQPISRSPSSNNAQQSLNLSKNHISSSQYSSKGMDRDSRNTSDMNKITSTTPSSATPSSVTTVSVSSMLNDKNFKIEIPNISNGSNSNSKSKESAKNEAKDLSSTKAEKPKEEKLSPDVDMKPIILEKPNPDPVKITDTDPLTADDKVEKLKDDNQIKAEAQPQDFASQKDFDQKEVKAEADSKPLSSNDNKINELEKSTDSSGAKENATDLKEEEVKADDKSNAKDEVADDVNASTKINETTKASSKKYEAGT